MFLMTIQNLGNEEQVEKWGNLAQQYKIHGCYAQTELGHGSNVNVSSSPVIIVTIRASRRRQP
jgi:alkylation response protein AidB-like acyl-CoA dehydrogenase